MNDVPDKIDPSGIPAFTGNLEALHEAYTDLSRDARAIRRLGRTVDHKFKGLSAFYESPEAEDLFALTTPVRDDTATFGGDLNEVQNALRMYRGTISGIVARLNVLRGEARSFLNSIADDDHWQSSQSNVDRNNELLQEVNRLVGRFWEAERTCANKITSLWGGTQWVADDGTGADHMYGVSVQEMEQAGETPWGKALERNARGWEIHHHIKGFVWDGVIVDGVWGTLVGLGGMVGFQGWDTFKESWNGLGQLAFGANSYTNPLVRLIYIATPDGAVKDWMDESQHAPLEAAKAFVAWDTWEDDPARASGAASFNIVTALATGGAGAGVRGASLGSRIAATTNRVGTALDPTTHLVNGARAITNIPKLGRVVDDLAATTARVNDFPDGTVRLPNGDILHPDGRLTSPEGSPIRVTDRGPVPDRELASVGARDRPDAAGGQGGDGPPHGASTGGSGGAGGGGQDGPTGGASSGGSGPVGSGGADSSPPTGGSGAGAGDGSGGSSSGGGTGHPISSEDWARLTAEEKIYFAEAELKDGAVSFANNAEAIRYGGENWNSYAENMPQSQRDAVYHYTLESHPDVPTYREINGYLRGNEALGTPDVLRHIEEMDKALAGNPVPQDVTVVRGTGLGHYGVAPQDMVGKTFTDSSYMSTSLGDPAAAFASNDAVLHLRLPEGTPALWVEKVSAFGPGERELLLGRDTSYTVTHAIRHEGQWHIYGEVLPR